MCNRTDEIRRSSIWQSKEESEDWCRAIDGICTSTDWKHSSREFVARRWNRVGHWMPHYSDVQPFDRSTSDRSNEVHWSAERWRPESKSLVWHIENYRYVERNWAIASIMDHKQESNDRRSTQRLSNRRAKWSCDSNIRRVYKRSTNGNSWDWSRRCKETNHWEIEDIRRTTRRNRIWPTLEDIERMNAEAMQIDRPPGNKSCYQSNRWNRRTMCLELTRISVSSSRRVIRSLIFIHPHDKHSLTFNLPTR